MSEKMKLSEINSRINACEQELKALDYARCKVAMECAAKIKALYPNEPMPEYEKYQAREETAKLRRAEIDVLREKIATCDYEDDENSAE